MPLVFVALLVIVVVGIILFLLTYFSATVTFKVLRSLFLGDLVSVALPASVKRPLRESRDHAQRIKTTVQQYPPGPIRDRLDRTIKPVDEWLANLARLEQALAKLYTQRNLAREIRQVEFEIDQLRRQLLTTLGVEVASLRALMDSKRKYCAALKELQSFQTNAELKIRKIASDLGATHAEIMLLIARGDFNDNRFQRLDENLQDHVSGLKDIMSAMDEIGYSRAAGY